MFILKILFKLLILAHKFHLAYYTAKLWILNEWYGEVFRFVNNKTFVMEKESYQQQRFFVVFIANQIQLC